MFKVMFNILVVLLAIGWIKSCIDRNDFECAYCGTFHDSHGPTPTKSFTIKKDDPHVRFCDAGEATYLNPERRECWNMEVSPIADDTGKSFSLMLTPEDAPAYQKAHLYPGMPSNCKFYRGGGWICGDTMTSVVIGTFGRSAH
jgi:hypothetical protein